ncbi:hypothetical protein [Pontibacter flavimaris]|uniref:hypothetical protein n=1 Tax=Pontibacter flavimaris TaxID=1797110 RepID=UPI00147AB4D3|nr:hypothetical protein [Pontibacter flavimaris]
MKRVVWMLLVVIAVVQPLSSTDIHMLFQADRSYAASHLCAKRTGLLYTFNELQA